MTAPRTSESTPLRLNLTPMSSYDKTLEEEMGMKSVKRVSYDSNSHANVLCQIYGSAWPKVLPFCLLNLSWIALIDFLRHYTRIDITFHSLNGFQIMGILVSFLVVSRVTMTYTNFKLAREYLSVCFRSARTICYYAALFTRMDRSEAAAQWRADVAYKCIMMLRVMTAANEHNLDDSDHPHGSWKMVPTDVQERLGFLDETTQLKWSHGKRSVHNENFRAPIVMSFLLQETIVKNREVLANRLAINEELAILTAMQEFLTGYHGIHKVITTTFPFPLAQMTRTFLFFWVFSLPLALIHTIGPIWQVMLIMFFLTYGFLGLEYVSIEMDDPFGDDPNDFDDWGMAQVIVEDIYIGIFEIDGFQAAQNLRQRVVDQIRCGEGNGVADLEDGTN